jgi:hypothetical protein
MVRGAGNITNHAIARCASEVPKFYCERQSGGLCRMHALNAYFGCPRLDRAAFEAEIAEYDSKHAGRSMPSANDYDATTSDSGNIIAHILSKHGVFARIYQLSAKSKGIAIAKANAYGIAFLYSPDHIWLMKRDDNVARDIGELCESSWYKIDSLSGVSKCELAYTETAIGMIVPTTRLKDEFDEIGDELNALVMPDIVDHLIDGFQRKKEIGDAEILMGAACSLLRLQNNGRTEYAKLDELFRWYDTFTRNFTGSNCMSLRFILNTVPQIIARIIAIWRCSKRMRTLRSAGVE